MKPKNTFFLSPSGKDSSVSGPWATLQGARDGLRKLRADEKLKGEATVIIKRGRYPLDGHVEFNEQDGHTSYVGAGEVIFDGGEDLRGWREETTEAGRAWILDSPDYIAGQREFRSLFVNGERRPRARFPKFLPDPEGLNNVLRIGKLRFPEKRALADGDNFFSPVPGDIQDWPSLPDSDIVILHYWIETRLGSPKFDADNGWIECARRSVFNLYESWGSKLARYYIDNLKEALTEPGEWYLDRKLGRLTYLPKPGETLAKTKLIAPKVHTFLRIFGTAFNHDVTTLEPYAVKHVENLHFRGLTFRHADWFHPLGGTLSHGGFGEIGIPLGSSPQGAIHVPATVVFRFARHCSLEQCIIEKIGFTAVEFGMGCQHSALKHCTLREIGGGGVRVDGSELDQHITAQTGYIAIEDNTITDIGRVFHQGVGVFVVRAFSCSIRHNHIARTCYTGISCGWSWGYRETISKNHVIENNLIHDIGRGVLSDMGGIYLLGVQPGTIVRGNHIHSVSSAEYGGWGIYPDEGSAHMVFESNWVHDTQGSAFKIHFSRELIVRDNVFAGSKIEGVIGIGQVEKWIAATFVNNLLLGPAPALFEGGYHRDVRDAFRSDANVIWFANGIPPCTNPVFNKDKHPNLSFEEWQKAGLDRNSLVVDPKARITASNFVLPKNSPARRSGFRPYDWSQCGPRPYETQ